MGPQQTASGHITTQNLVPNGPGVATANSAVELGLAGNADFVGIQVTGTYTGALTVQATVDGTNWYAIGGTVVGNSIEDVEAGTAAATIASAAQKVYRVRAAGYAKIRVTALSAVTGDATVSLIATK